MPTYLYRCRECGEAQDVIHGFNDAPTIRCGCGNQMGKDYSSVNLPTGPSRTYHDGKLIDLDATRKAEKNKDRDFEAYRRLRRDKVQPPQINGSANLEAKADTHHEVQSGHTFRSAASRKRSTGLLNDVLGPKP